MVILSAERREKLSSAGHVLFGVTLPEPQLTAAKEEFGLPERATVEKLSRCG